MRDAAIDARWKCQFRIESLESKPLPCGEIDLIAVAPAEDAAIVLVVEVKNSDIFLALPDFLEKFDERVTRAEDQIERKRDWVVRNCAEVWRRLEEILP